LSTRILLLLDAENGQFVYVLQLWFGFICWSSTVRNSAVFERWCCYYITQAKLPLL